MKKGKNKLISDERRDEVNEEENKIESGERK